MGYKDGFETAFVLGKCKSLVNVISPTMKHPTDVTAVLDKTRRGACEICNVELQNKNIQNYEHIPFSEVLNDQKTYSAKVIKTLYEYIEPLLEKSDIQINLIL